MKVSSAESNNGSFAQSASSGSSIEEAGPRGSLPYGTNSGEPEYKNHTISHFQAATALKPPFKSFGALRCRAMFKIFITCRGGPLQVISLHGKLPRATTATWTDIYCAKSDISRNLSDQISICLELPPGESHNGSFAQSASSRSSISREPARREVCHTAPTLGSQNTKIMKFLIFRQPWLLNLCSKASGRCAAAQCLKY